MSVCTTCFQPGIRDGKHDCPGLGEIQITRKLGHGLIVDTAPPHTRMALSVLVDAKWGARLHGDNLINIADQVLYRVTGYAPESAALLLELVEDWRPVNVLRIEERLTEEQFEELKARWLREHGNAEAAHKVELLTYEEQSDPFSHAERKRTGRSAGLDLDTPTDEEQPGA